MFHRFHMSQYVMRRAADWKARGFTETIDTFDALNVPQVLLRVLARGVPEPGGDQRSARSGRRAQRRDRSDATAGALSWCEWSPR